MLSRLWAWLFRRDLLGRVWPASAASRDADTGGAAYSFTVLLAAQPDGGFVACVPALPEVVTEGDTVPETLAMTEEAIRALLAYRTDMGIPVPDDTLPLVCRITVET